MRLRGASYQVYNQPEPRKSRRWLRHWLLASYQSGILPLPIDLWFTLPERGSVDPYRLGWVRNFIIEQVKLKDFREPEVETLRLFYDGDDELFEALLQQWMLMHLNYLRWYATVYLDDSIPLSELLSPPVVCYTTKRTSFERKLYVRYGLLFRAWEQYRRSPVVLPLTAPLVSCEDKAEAQIEQS